MTLFSLSSSHNGQSVAYDLVIVSLRAEKFRCKSRLATYYFKMTARFLIF